MSHYSKTLFSSMCSDVVTLYMCYMANTLLPQARGNLASQILQSGPQYISPKACSQPVGHTAQDLTGLLSALGAQHTCSTTNTTWEPEKDEWEGHRLLFSIRDVHWKATKALALPKCQVQIYWRKKKKLLIINSHYFRMNEKHLLCIFSYL